MNGFMRLLKDTFTERDGKSWDLKRIIWYKASMAFLALSAWAVIANHEHFNMVDFGIGVGSIIAAGGVALSMNVKGEQPIPGRKDEDDPA